MQKVERIIEKNGRIYDILEKMHLENRIISPENVEFDLTAPDFTYADEVIKKEREKGLNFIRENLTAAKCIGDAEREKNDVEGVVHG